jgi:hypothetical protein
VLVRVRAAFICAGLLAASIAGCSSTASPPTTAAVSSPTASATCTADCPQTSTAFLDGKLTVRFPVPWSIGEDQSVEFSGGPVGTSDVHRLLFWMDILPVDPHGKVVSGVPQTAGGLLKWLRERPNLAVTIPRATTIGAARMAAQVVDISIPGDAKSEDPSCPGAVCVAFLTWPGAGTFLYGIGPPTTVRLYVSNVVVDGKPHLFAVAIEAKDAADLSTFEPVAEQAIDSFTGPIVAA